MPTTTRSSDGEGGGSISIPQLTLAAKALLHVWVGVLWLVHTGQLLVLDKVRLWLVDKGEHFLVTILSLVEVDVV